ncbi:DUF4249 family protein [Nonlabens xiamenensis]|uniref:DUF4249 family protein n=1 Tax=Nonlabens xiamenensis TaxID=2341043 RepID=UPI000F6101B9|nr:DUF4249 family protein [Nonlabens xiamenensis]
MRSLLIVLCCCVCFSSCEDVIDVDLNTAAPRLVIDATMELNSDGTTSTRVKLTRSTGFYVEEPVIVTDAEVVIIDELGTRFPIPHNANGIYTSDNSFLSDRNDTSQFSLEITDNSFVYTATESLEQTVPITQVSQESIDGFGDDIFQIEAFFSDPQGLGNFYLFEYNDDENAQIDIGNDEFIDGNEAKTIFFLEDLEAGEMAQLRIVGIDEACFSFYETLLQQTDGAGGPFSTQPATVRGNIINSTNPDRFPFGYFRVSEVFEVEYTIQE